LPLPTPHPGESRDDFVSRFMSSEEARRQFPSRDQRLAEAFQKAKELMKAALAMVKAVLSAKRHKRLKFAKSATLTRIVKAEVLRLALCRRGKNGLTTLYKADGTIELQTLVKAVDEGTLLAVMYAPERPDADGHVASEPVVRQMLHTLMRNGAELDIEHNGKILDRTKAYVAEAFIVQKADERFQGWKNYDGTDAGDLTGAAAVQINIDDPALRESRKRGDWDGISLFGAGEGVPERVIIKSQDPQNPDTPMTPEQLKQILDGFTAGISGLQVSLVKAVTDAVGTIEAEEPAEKPEAVKAKAEVAPAFSGDPSILADLEVYEKAVRAYEFRKAVADGKMTADQIAELRKALSETQPSDAEIGAEAGDSAAVKSLKLQLFKAKRGSNAPAKGSPSPDLDQMQLDVAEGLELAKSINGESKAPAFSFRTHAG
jgi:hypothetical protein